MNSPRVSTTNATRKNTFRFRTNTNNDPKPLNSKNKNKNKPPKVRRRGMTYKNAQKIRGQFQKPPRPPSKAIEVRGPVYANSNEDPVNPMLNVERLSPSEMDAYIRRLRME